MFFIVFAKNTGIHTSHKKVANLWHSYFRRGSDEGNETSNKIPFGAAVLNKRIVLSCPVLCLVAQSCSTLCDPMGCRPPGCSVHGDSPGRNTGVGCHALLRGSSQSIGSPVLQADSLLSEPSGKFKFL